MQSVTRNRQSFRALLARDALTVLPGGFSPLEAVMAERAGFDAFFLAGSQTAACLYAVPDAGILGLHDMAGQAHRVAGRAGIPVLVDGDTGYGNAVNAYFAVQALVRSGAAAVQIEDQACERIPAPVMTVWGGPGPGPDIDEYERLGLRIALFPVLASKAGMQAAWDALHDFRQRGAAALADQARAAAESPWGQVPLTTLTGADAVRRLEDDFLPAELRRDYRSTFGSAPPG